MKSSLMKTLGMLNHLIEHLQRNSDDWEKYKSVFVEQEISSRTILLQEGETASQIFFIKKGCLRMWFNKDGKDITLQFFFENQVVASIESFIGDRPSLFSIETIEPSVIVAVGKVQFEELFQRVPSLKDGFQNIIFQRFSNYASLFLSRIKDSPQERYEDLLQNFPEIVRRVPQHYIASYLGITPISLSRIRNRR